MINPVSFRKHHIREDVIMANRRFEMYEYRQVIHRMRMGESDRAIAWSKLMGRLKCAQVCATANGKGWLKDAPLPEDRALV